jgi:hypothetical protein
VRTTSKEALFGKALSQYQGDEERQSVMIVRFVKRGALASVLAIALSISAGAGQAVAAMPWWHVNTVSAPASRPGGESRLVLEVTNLGDAFANGFEHPITITDALPAGVTPTHVYGEGGGAAGGIGFNIGSSVEEPLRCSFVSQIVTCAYGGPLLPYERFMVVITVNVASGSGTGMSEVNVSGGGAAPILARHALALNEGTPGYGVENYEVTPEEEGGALDTQAGSHPFQLTTTLTFNTKAVPVVHPNAFLSSSEILPEVQPVELTKDLRFNLPPGLVGNPTPLPKCRVSVFVHPSEASHCPDNTIVGIATPIVTNPYSSTYAPLAITVPLYSIEPAVGEPARFGFTTSLGPVVLDTSVRTGSDYGVVVTVPDIIDDVAFIGTQVTFWGVPDDSRHDNARGACLGEHEEPEVATKKWEYTCPIQEKPQPLIIMPTSCTGPLQTSVEGDPWAHIGEFASKQYTFSNGAGEPVPQDGCDRLNFEPSITVAPDGQQGSTPTGLTVGEHVDQESSLNPTGLAESAVKDTTVTLPAGVAINPAGADGLSACSLSQAGLENGGEQSCPESSKIGTVEIRTPLLPDPLTGAAYLAEQYANPFGSLVAMYIVVYDPVSGVRVKVAGEVKPDAVTGQLVATFDNTPPLPFEELSLHFFGGSRAPLGTPSLCGSYTTSASIAPWSGNPPGQASSQFQITSGPNGTPCSDPLPFKPELTTGSLNIQAGAFTPFTMTMSREDGNQNLDAIQLKMPSGLLGTLSSVKLCGEAEGDAGTCGPESLIGHTTVSVGLGGNPYTVNGGEVFITGPYKGAPYGLSIVNPAKAGPFDLGKVIVRAKIEVNPENAALTITSDATGPYAIPQIIDGIPLEIKHVNVSIDRPDFTFNPTNCAPQEIGGSLTSSQGTVSALHVPFQVTNCAVLGFKPVFSVSTAGKTSRAKGASLSVKLTYPKAGFGTQANIGKVKVDLPKQLPSRLTTLQKACPAGTFETNPAACPPDSRIGSATATTPVLPVHLEGPAYFVSHGGAKFPELIVALSGEGVTVYLHGETFISPQGITSSTFRTIPDVPIGVFELKLPQGPDSALAANGNLCTSKLAMPTTFVAANGLSIHQSTHITVTGCAKKKVKKARKASRDGKQSHR